MGRNPYVSFLFALSCTVLYASTCIVLAEVPATAKIVFSSWRHRNLDIYLMNPDGSEEVRLTHHLARDGGPKWSPSGEHILFSSVETGLQEDWDLYLMDAMDQMCGECSRRKWRGPVQHGPRMANRLLIAAGSRGSPSLYRINRW